MSSIQLSGNASGAGVFTIASPNSASSYTATLPAATDTLATLTQANSYYGFKNRIINGQMQVAQRATSGTSGAAVPTTSPTYPSVDRFYAYATGATVTVAQVAGSGAVKNNLQVTGAASVATVGIGQRIEQLNSYDLAGSICTISANISNSLLTTVTWTASYATSADTWSAKTQIATGTFTVTSTLTNYNAQISVPAAATTGIEILFTVGAQTSGTWVIGNVQLEKNSTATSFDYRPYGTELALCQRYYEKSYNIDVAPATATAVGAASGGTYNGGTISSVFIKFSVTKRATPTVSVWGTDGTSGVVTDNANRTATIVNTGMSGTTVSYAGNGGFLGYTQFTAVSEL